MKTIYGTNMEDEEKELTEYIDKATDEEGRIHLDVVRSEITKGFVKGLSEILQKD